MKKILSVLLLTGIIFTSCMNQTTADKTTPEETNLDDELVKPVLLSKQMFLDEIMDYEENPSEWVYKGDMPGLIDFYADWCAPCKVTSPILEDLAQEYKGKIKVYKVDIEAERELAAVFGIQSIPSFLFIPENDNPVMTAGIAQTKEETEQMFRKQIEDILLKNN